MGALSLLLTELQERESWWKTVPGLLTAVAGLLTAITGLLVILFQAGFIGNTEKESDKGGDGSVRW
jgi:hypothetical protein